MSEFLENVSEGLTGSDDEAPERGRPGTNPPQEPQPGLYPGAGEGPEQSEHPQDSDGGSDQAEPD
jgi:hypothetical protein